MLTNAAIAIRWHVSLENDPGDLMGGSRGIQVYIESQGTQGSDANKSNNKCQYSRLFGIKCK